MSAKFNIGDKVWVLYGVDKEPQRGVEMPVEAIIVDDNGYYYNVTTVKDNTFISTIEKKLVFRTFAAANRTYKDLTALIWRKKEVEEQIYDLIYSK